MTSPIHGRQVLADGIHSIVAFTYATSGSLAAASGFQTYDLYKLALVTGDNSMWVLVNTAAPTWAPVQTSGSGGPSTGAALPLQQHIAGVAGTQQVDQAVFQGVGAFEFNPSGPETMAPSGSSTYTAYFQPIVEVYPTGSIAEIRLYNITTNAVVTDSTLTGSSLIPQRLRSLNLYSSLATGSNVYEIQMRLQSAGGSNRATCKGAKLFVTWS